MAEQRELNTRLYCAARDGNIAEAKSCLAQGASVNYQGDWGRTPLHRAARRGNVEMARLMIQNGGQLNITDISGDTPLHLAAYGGSVEMTSWIVQQGGKLDARNNEGQTPYDQANKFGGTEVMELLEKEEYILKTGLPAEVGKLDKQSAEVYSNLLREENYPHFEVRTMLAGEQNTGKTTIARCLIGKRPTRLRRSTDGIDLYRGLSFVDIDNDDWLDGEQEFQLDDITVSRSLRQHKHESKDTEILKPESPGLQSQTTEDSPFEITDPSLMKPTVANVETKVPVADDSENLLIVKAATPSPEIKICPTDISNEPLSSKSGNENFDSSDNASLQNPKADTLSSDDISVHNNEESSEIPYSRNQPVIDKEAQNISNISQQPSPASTTVIKKPSLITKMKKIFGVSKDVEEIKMSITKEKYLKKSYKVGKLKLHNRKLAPVIIWDFGGQDVFYSTHQTFLTYRALYIIVLDGSRNIDDPCPFEQYLPGKSGTKTPRDYIRFWINTIVTYCKGAGHGFPKIMVVLTHKDRVNKEDIEPRRQKLFGEIKEMFSRTPLLEHLVIEDQIFVNARDKEDTEMSVIKKTIIRLAKTQPTWGQKVPKCFIPLELEFSSLARKGINVITMEQMKKINSEQPIRPLTDLELKVFLKFQHATGKILYFDETNLESHIMISPTHLIDAFKSIVTDKRFLGTDRKRHEAWEIMGKKGVINKNVIDEIWRKKYAKFYGNKDYLLGVMTHLDILVEPRRYDQLHQRIAANFYYIASMVRTEDKTGYLQSPTFSQRNIALAFYPSSVIVPPALCFRFISYCLSIWGVKQHGDDNDDMLFHRSAVFTVDSSLDMHVQCEDEYFIIRLVHRRNRTLIIRDLASSVRECLVSALEKISQLYIKTSSEKCDIDEGSFQLSICCGASEKPCFLSQEEIQTIHDIWICPKHQIEHGKDILTCWFSSKEMVACEEHCPVTDKEFLQQTPTDLHLRRLALEYNDIEVRELAIRLKLPYSVWENQTRNEQDGQGETHRFEVLRQCRERYAVTFFDIKEATEKGKIRTPHTICKVVRDQPIGFDLSPEKWDLYPTDKDIDNLAPLVGGDSLHFLVELGMNFTIWEQITYKQTERDLIKLNRDILKEWKGNFCETHGIRPSLRHIAQAFNNMGKNIKIVENALFS